jgi:GNAT superfamily N-acetyltransferase
VNEIIEVYISSEINRPVTDKNRIAEMYAHSNLVVTAWHTKTLVGIARALTDYCYCCYLLDLAVRSDYQRLGIGKKLVNLTKEAAPAAINYYPKIGFKKIGNGLSSIGKNRYAFKNIHQVNFT